METDELPRRSKPAHAALVLSMLFRSRKLWPEMSSLSPRLSVKDVNLAKQTPSRALLVMNPLCCDDDAHNAAPSPAAVGCCGWAEVDLR